MWFLKILILQLAGLNSIKSETDIRKLLFLGPLLTEPRTTSVVKSLFQSRATSYFDPNISQLVFYQVFVTPCVNTICLPTLKLGFTALSFLVMRNGSQLFTVKCVTPK